MTKKNVRTVEVKFEHVDLATGKRIAYADLDISDEVRQATRLPLHQRKLFGAAKDRGMSDADALAFAKAPAARDDYQSRLTNAWKTP